MYNFMHGADTFSTTFHIYEKGIQLRGGHAGKI